MLRVALREAVDRLRLGRRPFRAEFSTELLKCRVVPRRIFASFVADGQRVLTDAGRLKPGNVSRSASAVLAGALHAWRCG